jgi:hypothetical protein
VHVLRDRNPTGDLQPIVMTPQEKVRPEIEVLFRAVARDARRNRPTAFYGGVKIALGSASCEHMSSGLPLKADIARCGRHVANGPRLCKNLS